MRVAAARAAAASAAGAHASSGGAEAAGIEAILKSHADKAKASLRCGRACDYHDVISTAMAAGRGLQ
jgi:hypothetical protein